MFTVTWRKTTRDRLTEIWLNDALHRAAVTRAANDMDLRLREDPLNCCPKVSELQYEWIHPPLVILYTVSQADRLVEVIDLDLVV